MVSCLGLGGLLAGRLRLEQPSRLGVVLGSVAVSGLALGAVRVPVLAGAAQVLLALALATAGVFLTRRLHDAVPSALRTGVAAIRPLGEASAVLARVSTR